MMMNTRYLLLLITLITAITTSATAVSSSEIGSKEETKKTKDDDGDSSSWLIMSGGGTTGNNNTSTSSSNNHLRKPHNPSTTTTSSSSFTTKFHNITNKTACDIIKEHDLPEECTCREPHRGVIVECLKHFNSTYLNDTIGMKINIDPCNSEGSRVSIDVTEKTHDIDYAIVGIRAGEAKNFPIPGCSIIVPYVGHLGLDAAVLVYGNPDMLTLKIGLNACTVLREHEFCASSIPGLSGVLPWWVLSGTYSFGDFCNSTNSTYISPSTHTGSVESPSFTKKNGNNKEEEGGGGGKLLSLPWFMKTTPEEDEKIKTIFDLSDAAYA